MDVVRQGEDFLQILADHQQAALAPAQIEKLPVDELAGADIDISIKDGKAWANSATIVKTDIDASNGVIHVIDGVLLPPEESASK